MEERPITLCLLNADNPFLIGTQTIGSKILQSSKLCLWNQRPSDLVDTIVFHYISAIEFDQQKVFDLASILNVFCFFCVSSHYLILRDGSIYQLVPEEMRAWHCGGSKMPPPDNRTNVNDFSIGIELVATADSGYTDTQYDSLQRLCSKIDSSYGKKCTRIGHQDIAGRDAITAGQRSDIKLDPGPLFDWSRFC
jgi:N-acetyl-anhydromuramyl-L-alanine amidase AmpD